MTVHLMKDERVVWQSYPGKSYRIFLFTSQFGIAVVLAIMLFALNKELQLNESLGDGTISFLYLLLFVGGGLYAGYNQLLLMFIRYYITSDRIIIKKGFFNRKLTSVKHENIHDTKVEQTFAERLISTGHVYIFTANDISVSQDDSHLNKVPTFKNIDNPFEIHKLLEEAIEANSKQS